MAASARHLRQSPPDMRRAERVSIDVRAELKMDDMPSVRIVIKDLSETGFRCKVGAYVGPGRRVWLCLPAGEDTESKLVWFDGTYCGFVFLAPISTDQVTRILA